VKFLVAADSAEDAEELVETACEKAASSVPAGELSYEGIIAPRRAVDSALVRW